MEIFASEDRIPPVRGIVLTQDARGRVLPLIDVKRWLRVNRTVFKAEKIDVFMAGPTPPWMSELIECSDQLDTRLSLRTDCTCPPPALDALKKQGLYDVFLCPRSESAEHLDAWLTASREALLPVRVQVRAPFLPGFDADALAQRLADAAVAVVNIALFDPFYTRVGCRGEDDSRRTIEQMNALAAALDTRGVEANLIGLPLCLATLENRPKAANTAQFFSDHQQYSKDAYELATRLYRMRPALAGTILLILLAQGTFERSFADAVLLRLLYGTQFAAPWLELWHKLTRRLRLFRSVPKARDESVERKADRMRLREGRALGPVCSRCSLRRICDHQTRAFERVLPGVNVVAQEGELVLSPLHFARAQRKCYDPIDAARLELPEICADLSKAALDLVTNQPADRRMMPYEYTVENSPFQRLEGGVRWLSVTNTEKRSTPLGVLEPPFTLSVTFGGGIAEYVGFSFGRYCKIVCPMEAYRHRLVLHVAADGHYVLLREGRQVRPVEFEGRVYTPMRLGSRLEPRISIWNIDGRIVTQFVELWQGTPRRDVSTKATYSILIVNTRYARRLEAALLSIAHQERVDLAKLEVIVCYVPGLDTTDDLIDSMGLSFPKLRILRAPFPERNAHSKGFMINESVNMASGEWLVLMDADIILPPGMFARIEEVTALPSAQATASVASHQPLATSLIAPDGRKMLDKETTAKILLGELEPWRDWDAILAGPGEYRYREARGVPIGFFQCFRASFMEKTKYAELEHFEGADMHFGYTLQTKLGKETRLSGLPVLHLDHGGSQWYGTQRHF